MILYADQVRRIQQAATLEDIRSIARELPAQAGREGGVLYSGWVGRVRAESIALEISRRAGLSIINETPRAKFLSDDGVRRAIEGRAEEIFRQQGQTTQRAAQSAEHFLYGDPDALAVESVSVKNCLWGEASREFASSLRGRVLVIASAADAKRVLAQVEIPFTLDNGAVDSLAGQATEHLRMLRAQGSTEAVLSAVQRQFSDATNKGIYTLPDHPGNAISQVSVSKEVATALGLDADKFIGGANLQAGGLVRAPVEYHLGVQLPEAAGAMVRGAVGDIGATSPAAAHHIGKGVRLIPAATIAYDMMSSAESASVMLEQGNRTGAASEVVHFGSRNLGMWGGAVLGAEVFGAAGVETGPWDLIVGGAGALVGAFAGDRLADAVDRQRIYRQRGPDGRVWTFDPEDPAQGWTRTTSELDIGATRLNDGFPVYRQSGEIADAALSDRLNYQASGTAVELALAHPPRQRDPYTQPAAPGDTHSVREALWNRDPRTHVWTRRVVDGLIEHGMVSAHVERATVERADALDRAAEEVVAENAARSRESIASRYQSAYRESGWERYGPAPESVTEVLRTAEDRSATSNHANPAGTLALAGRMVASPAPVPAHLLDFRQTGHPLHAFYEQTVAKVHDMEDRHQMPYGLHSERLAAALTDAVAAYNVGKGPDERFGTLERVELRGAGADCQAVAVDQRVNYHLPQVQVSVPVDKAVGRSVEQSSHDWARRHMPHLREATQAKEADLSAPGSHAGPACTARCPDIHRDTRFGMLRGKVAEAYAHAGIFRSRTQLDEATAAVLPHLGQGRADPDSTRLTLLADPQTGVIGPGSDLLLQQDHGTLSLRTRIPSEELQTHGQAFHPPAQDTQEGLLRQEPQQAQVR